MSLSRLARKVAGCWFLAVGIPGALFAQGNYVTNGYEYPIAGNLSGDQMYPGLSLTTNGGYVVWEDNFTDGDGLGISALRLDSSFSGSLSPFRVNQIGAGDQERPQVALLSNGGAAFVWQGGRQGFQHIYARFLSGSNTWATDDVLVNSATNRYQLNPVIATLTSGNVVVVWGSFNQQSSNSLQDVYGQILSPAGQKIGGEFLINQFTPFNQRTPTVAALPGGGFVVAWVSEQERSGNVDNPSADFLYSPTNLPSVDIFARLYNGNGSAAGNEFLVNTGSDVCANPRVAAAVDGSFMVAWGQKSLLAPVLSWDVFCRPYSTAGVGGIVRTVNTYLYGDQYAPQIAVSGTDYLMVWTSLGQDGSREGVFGQFLRNDGTPAGGEFRVNTTTYAQQMQPSVASDGNGHFLAVWTSFVGGDASFDLYAQRYVNLLQPLVPMNAPFVYVPFVLSNGVYQPQLQVAWPLQTGLPIDHYEVNLDGATSPVARVTTNNWLMTAANGLTTSSTHSFRVAYATPDGRLSPLSPPTLGTTWGGQSWGGVPWEWMTQYYGAFNVWFDQYYVPHYNWPSANAPVAPGGPTLVQVFLTGANPTNSSTWLRTSLSVKHDMGLTYYLLAWNTQPGLTYQVQTSSNMTAWANLGGPRFAAGAADSMTVPLNNLGYYRVFRLR
jgi:hypothetical protein